MEDYTHHVFFKYTYTFSKNFSKFESLKKYSIRYSYFDRVKEEERGQLHYFKEVNMGG